MRASLDYPNCAACQLSISNLTSLDEVAVTIDGAGAPIWAVCTPAFDRTGTTTVSTAAGGLLVRLSSIELTRDTLTVLAPVFGPLHHRGPGPENTPLIVQLYVWAQARQKISLHRAGAARPTIGFVFNHAQSVSDWESIDGRGLSVDWPVPV